MTIERTEPSKAWIIIADKPRSSYMAESIREITAGQPLAVFPPTWGLDRLLPIVDGFVQFIMNSPEDMLPYLKSKDAPYRAQKEAWGQQAMGGFDPYVEAISVGDLRLCTDTESGENWFEYTRIAPQKPGHLSEDVVD